jgi:hypothetical protein
MALSTLIMCVLIVWAARMAFGQETTCKQDSPTVIHCWDSRTGKTTATIEHQPGSPYSYSRGPAGNFTTFFDGSSTHTWQTPR